MTSQDQNDLQSFSRRAFVVAGLQGLVFFGLGARLFHLQVLERDRYKTLADRNRIDVQYNPPRRGRIMDAAGLILADNTHDYRVFVLPDRVTTLDQSMDRLAKIITVTKAEREEAAKRARKQNRFMPVRIRDNLSWDEVAAIELNLSEADDVRVQLGLTRRYPLKETSAHLIGYVGAPTDEDTQKNALYKIPDVRIGKTGVERAQNEPLLGTPGASYREVDVRGRVVRELETRAGEAGDDISLTIRTDIQKVIAQHLGKSARSASCVVMDAVNGDVLGMVSHPSYDPNKFATGISHKDWALYRDDKAAPMVNKAVSGQYPPGSTFKMVTALAALEAGLIRASTTCDCPGYYDVGSQRFHCWKHEGHGKVDLVKALSESCDVYFYEIARDIGIDRLAAMARRLGLGVSSGLGLPEEKEGLVPDRAWKRKVQGKPWLPGDTINASIGQGNVLTTPLQLAVMTARLVNGGIMVSPRMIGARNGKAEPRRSFAYRPWQQAHIDLVMDGMRACVNDADGTAIGSRIWVQGMEMGGKTGTAQVKRISKMERALGITNDSLAWNLRHHALFVGYAPLAAPRYVCSVVVEHGGGGSAAAAPLARDIMMSVQSIMAQEGKNA